MIIRYMKEDDSIISMVDSNLHRDKILFSEKAFAYYMKNEAMKRKTGKRRRTQEGQLESIKGTKTIQLIGKETGESPRQVLRYIRLTLLVPELLDMLDEGKISFNPAVELSFLSEVEYWGVRILKIMMSVSAVMISSISFLRQKSIRALILQRSGLKLKRKESGFGTMNRILIANFNAVVHKDDTVYILGDLAHHMQVEDINKIIGKLNGRKILIKGNHDKKYDACQCGRKDSRTSDKCGCRTPGEGPFQSGDGSAFIYFGQVTGV